MKKNQFSERLAEKKGVSKTEAAEWVDSMFNEITEVLKGGDEVNVTGFGVFKVVHRKAREGRNPRTGEKVDIPAKNVPKFKAGKVFKDAVM